MFSWFRDTYYATERAGTLLFKQVKMQGALAFFKHWNNAKPRNRVHQFFELTRLAEYGGLLPYEVWASLVGRRTWTVLDQQIFFRGHWVARVCYPIITAETFAALVDICKRYDLPVLDAGARTGFLAGMLNGEGVYTVAWDKAGSGHPGRRAKYWLVVLNDYSKTPTTFFKIVLLSWPDVESPDALALIQSMRPGQLLIYQGEGCGGACATDEFFEELEQSGRWFFLKEDTDRLNKHHLQFIGLHDHWAVWARL